MGLTICQLDGFDGLFRIEPLVLKHSACFRSFQKWPLSIGPDWRVSCFSGTLGSHLTTVDAPLAVDLIHELFAVHRMILQC